MHGFCLLMLHVVRFDFGSLTLPLASQFSNYGCVSGVISSAAGIDNDVKVWAPTAENAREPIKSTAVNRLLRDNSASRGESRAMRQV